jgi:replicative DNA helicase
LNLDLILLKLLLNKTLFDKYHKILNLDFYKANNKELFKLFLALFKYQEQSKEEDASLDNFIMFFYTLYPLVKADEKTYIDTVVEKISNLEVDETVALEYLKKHHEQTIATEIAIKALEISQGRGEMSLIKDLLETVQDIQETTSEELFVTDDLEILVNDVISSQGLRWRLEAMNKSLGSLRKGDFGFIFARPETGKTTFLASEVTYMAEQAKEQSLGPVLWLNNEEQGSKVKLRCYQAVFGISQQELFTNLDYYKDEYETRIGGHIKIYDNAKITKTDVEKICKDINPSLIIIDQIDKIAWPDSERYDLKMKAIYQWARELSKGYGAVISVCQAGGTAEGKKYLNMNDVDSSHTAKQGEADFMIGIGKTNTDGEEYMRFLSICKNKLSGDTDSLSDLRHGKMPILIQPELARYADSVEWR